MQSNNRNILFVLHQPYEPPPRATSHADTRIRIHSTHWSFSGQWSSSLPVFKVQFSI